MYKIAPMPAKALCFFAILLLMISPVLAQEAEKPPVTEEIPVDNLLKTMAMDIATSDWASLVSWARGLGLPDDGTVAELRQRLYTHYGVRPDSQPQAKGRIITIESADRTEYLSASEDSQASIRFTGNVSIVIKDDTRGQTIQLNANEVLLNPDSSILSARGNVFFERKGSEGTDWFVGDLLDIDLESQEGVFLEGKSQKGEGQNRLSFRADDIISRGNSVLVFRDGIISSCDEDSPHYSIRASKIWILGPNEWAILNATLSVGEVPLLYIPFFYYPGEEIVFHPVFGYRDKEGRFVQTTTYLLGAREPKEEEISLFRLSDPASGNVKEVRGFFLRSTNEKAGRKSSNIFKVMLDIYTGLGVFAGAEGKMDRLGPLENLSFYLGLGLSRSLFPLSSGSYSPHIADNDWESSWHESSLFGSTIPLRYALEFAARIKLGALLVNFSLPFYSDPWFFSDFSNRSEHMAWLKFLKQEEKEEARQGVKTSFTDELKLNVSIPTSSLPSAISSISINRLNMDLQWKSKARTKENDETVKLYNANPDRHFFYPDRLTIVDTSISLGGSLLKYPSAGKTARPLAAQGSIDPLAIPEPVLPWQAGQDETKDYQEKKEIEESAIPGFILPPLLAVKIPSEPGEPSFNINWRLSPSASWKTEFANEKWKTARDIDWAIRHELQTLSASGDITFTARAPVNVLDWRLSLIVDSKAQWYTNINEDPAIVTEANRERWALDAARYRNDRINGQFSLKYNPFSSSWLWASTSLGYNLTGRLYDYSFKTMEEGNPVYGVEWIEWSKEKISTHSLSANIAVKPWDLSQSLSIQASLPPLLESYSGNMVLNSPVSRMTASTRLFILKEGEDYKWAPLNLTLGLFWKDWPRLDNTFIWDLEKNEPGSLNSKLSWQSFSAELVFRMDSLRIFETGSGWVSQGEDKFMPVQFNMSYNFDWKPEPLWKQRIAWTLKSSLSFRQSFVRFTDSSMDFTLGFNIKIHEFLDIQFSSVSRNSAFWRYYPQLFVLPAGMVIEPVNPLTDLVKSFNFFNNEDRRESLFKLKTLSVKAVHHLHDWDLSFDLAVSPVLKDGDYEFRTVFGLNLVWLGVPEIKASYKKTGDYEEWE